MPRDPKELGSKLISYADAIVAFAFVQAITFSFALGNNATFLKHALRVWWLIPLAILVANVFYAFLVHTCHEGSNALLDPFAPPGDAWERRVRTWRFLVIGLGLVLSLAAFGASSHGSSHDSGPQCQATH